MEDELKAKRDQKWKKKYEDQKAKNTQLENEIKTQEAAEVDPEVEIEVQLTGKALRIKEINKLTKKAFSKEDYEELTALIFEYGGLKKGIKKLLAYKPTYQIINSDAKDIIQKISNEEPLEIDKLIPAINNQLKDEDKIGEFDDDEIADLIYSEKYILPGCTIVDYMTNMLSINSLVLGKNVPAILQQFVKEAKYCYAFNRHISVYCLCRTILETSIMDICQGKGIIKRNRENVTDIKNYRIKDLIREVSRGELRDRINDIYGETSSLIHGRKTIDANEAREMFKKTINVIQDLYDIKSRGV